jgi:hypothetical protein
MSVIGIIECVLQESNKPNKKPCGLDRYKNYSVTNKMALIKMAMKRILSYPFS